MALPVILVNSTGGSDTQASGAGPSTALFGTTDASFSAATVTLTAGTDLSGVAVDGSHVLYLLTSTGVRFFKITASAGSGGATPTVDVTPNPAGTSTGRTWAIGGKRASCFSASSYLLWENASGNGDLMPGWIVEMESGHSETIAAGGADGTGRVLCRRSGDVTSGAITLRGVSGAATLPLLTFGGNVTAFQPVGNYRAFLNFEMRNTNATKTASTGFTTANSDHVYIDGIKISHSTNKFWKGIVTGAFNKWVIRNCEIGYCASVGIDASNAQQVKIYNNFVHDCGALGGIYASGAQVGIIVLGNICYNNTGDGIYMNLTTASTAHGVEIIGNTCDSNTSDGIDIANANVALGCMMMLDNIVSNNGAYGINFSAATAIQIAAEGVHIDSNNTYLNTSGATNPASIASNDPGLNPSFTNAASGDFSIGTNLKAKGYPLAGSLYVGKTSATYSYVDPGAAQRQEAGGSGATPTFGLSGNGPSFRGKV